MLQRAYGHCALLIGIAIIAALPAVASAQGRVWTVEWDGAIGPATVDYVSRNLDAAAADGATLFVMRLDTPGGLVESTRRLNQKILASPVPVAMWVGPAGARAASAGTYLMYASHIAAMAPATHIGASTPIGIGTPQPTPPLPFPRDEPDGKEDGGTSDPADGAAGDPTAAAPADNGAGQKTDPLTGNDAPTPAAAPLQRGGNDPQAPHPGTAAERKAVNDMVAYLQGLAELRGRNSEWAEATVRDAASLTATQALQIDVIDYIAATIGDLLAVVDGKEVTTATGTTTLATKGASITAVESDWRNEFLKFITNPTIAYQLLAFGGLLLLIEFYNPGIGLPGVVGLICLVTGMYGMQMLPVNYAGLLLMVVGLGLVIMEIYTPTFGLFGLGGGGAFVLGSIMLMDTDLEAFRISIAAIAFVSSVMFGFTALVAFLAIRSHRRKTVAGEESLIGAPATALGDFSPSRDGFAGRVLAQSEHWNAVADVALATDDELTVTHVNGLTLTVIPEEN